MLFSVLDQPKTYPSSLPPHQNVTNLVLLNTGDSDFFWLQLVIRWCPEAQWLITLLPFIPITGLSAVHLPRSSEQLLQQEKKSLIVLS